MKKICQMLFSLFVVTVLFGAVSASARADFLGFIDNFSQPLSYAQYKVLREGDYSAESINNEWYYHFTLEGNYVFIKCSAFWNTADNSYGDLNAALTKGVASTDSAKEASCVYKTSSSTVMNDYFTYYTYLTYMKVSSSLSGQQVVLKCKMCGHALFTYQDPHARGVSYYSTQQYYNRALQRATGDVPQTVTPKFTLSVDQAGSKGIILKNFQYQSKGVVAKKTNIDEWIQLAFTTGKVLINASSENWWGTAESLYSVLKQGINLTQTSKDKWALSEYYLLTNNGKKALGAKFTSPVKLKSCDDYFQVEVNLSDSPSMENTPTKLSVKFFA